MRLHGLGLEKLGASSKALSSGFARCARMGWTGNEVSHAGGPSRYALQLCVSPSRFTAFCPRASVNCDFDRLQIHFFGHA